MEMKLLLLAMKARMEVQLIPLQVGDLFAPLRFLESSVGSQNVMKCMWGTSWVLAPHVIDMCAGGACCGLSGHGWWYMARTSSM